MGARLTYARIDDCLGDESTRFFGAGHRRARHTVRDVTVVPAGRGDGAVTATVDVTYPADWSKKVDGVDIRPHLSSIDTLLLGVQLCEAYLVQAMALAGLVAAGVPAGGNGAPGGAGGPGGLGAVDKDDGRGIHRRVGVRLPRRADAGPV